MARLVASLMLERKGEDVVILDMSDVLPITDFFVIGTGRNARHVDSMVELVIKRLKELGLLPANRSGLDASRWALVDYGSVVVHVFQPSEREFYDLELLWGDAERVPFDEDPDPTPGA
ncbi:MAG: ribosome silencing factor [Planctomycetota bacterium]